MIWLIQVDGLIVDARGLPLPVQAPQAFKPWASFRTSRRSAGSGTAAWLSESR